MSLRTPLLAALTALVLTTPAPAQQSSDGQIETFRCAAGYGCHGLAVGESEARVLIGAGSRQEARDAYALNHPDAYFADTLPEEGEAGNPVELDKLEGRDDIVLFPEGGKAPDNGLKSQWSCAAGYGCDGLTVDQQEALALVDATDAEHARDQYALKYPEDYISNALADGGDPVTVIDLFADGEGSKKPIELFPAKAEEAERPNMATHPVDFTKMEGFAEAPCPGNLYEAPIFMNTPGLAVSTCTAPHDPQGNCGLPAANGYCLTTGTSLRAACYGVTTASRAANLGNYCEGGSCSAFSFVVCR
ncbi:hypothetical protein [Mesorhizobium sp. Z1-4]|uniref:hypothetical protein n=1 Tax=Mesorhizobium sp. Z1-4 TaxID=2448478 RepID=UPI000FD9593A|nr:hypothetical protein [Mesorhizobium sp. Z1-4]